MELGETAVDQLHTWFGGRAPPAPLNTRQRANLWRRADSKAEKDERQAGGGKRPPLELTAISEGYEKNQKKNRRKCWTSRSIFRYSSIH
jgi:hypothetical protein